jgi:uncharacterized protein
VFIGTGCALHVSARIPCHASIGSGQAIQLSLARRSVSDGACRIHLVSHRAKGLKLVFLRRFGKLLFGLFLYALGIVFTIQANIGFAPWDVLHVGLSRAIGLSIGAASILVGLLIVLVILAFKERIGFGTILNMVLIGIFMDFLFFLDFIPTSTSIVAGLPELVLGLFIISIASYFYIGSGFGAGPRDSLMVLLTKRLKLPVGLIRTLIEVSVIIAGWFLGGTVGLGTLVASLAIGLCIQITFSCLKFDPTSIRHESFSETLKSLVPIGDGIRK